MMSPFKRQDMKMLLSNSRLGTPRLLEGSSGYLPPSLSTGSSLEEASREPESHRVLLSPLYCSTGITGALRLLWGWGVKLRRLCSSHPPFTGCPSPQHSQSVQGTECQWVFRALRIEEPPDPIVHKSPISFLKMIKANLCILVPVTGGEGCLFV